MVIGYSTRNSRIANHGYRNIQLVTLIALLGFILILAPYLIHSYISTLDIEIDSFDYDSSIFSNIDLGDEAELLKISDLKLRIDELKKIRFSINNELRQLEQKKDSLVGVVSEYTGKLDKVKKDIEQESSYLRQMSITVENMKLKVREKEERAALTISAPKAIYPSEKDMIEVDPPKYPSRCRMHFCFDYSRCSITSNFLVYIYDPLKTFIGTTLDDNIVSDFLSSAENNNHVTNDPLKACIFIIVIGNVTGLNRYDLQDKLSDLKYWNGDGRNHVLLQLGQNNLFMNSLANVNTGRAIVASSQFLVTNFRLKFDVMLPQISSMKTSDIWKHLPDLSPAKRFHFLTFQGQFFHQMNLSTSNDELFRLITKEKLNMQDSFSNMNKSFSQNAKYPQELVDNNNLKFSAKKVNTNMKMEDRFLQLYKSINSSKNAIIDVLNRMQNLFKDNVFNFQFSCNSSTPSDINGEWFICGTEKDRQSFLLKSTFSLILTSLNKSVLSSTFLQNRIYEALKHGAIPVILGDENSLPLVEIINWKKAAIILPTARITELHFILQSISDFDILEMKRQGRQLFENILGNLDSIFNSLLALLRIRLNIPALPIKDEVSMSVFNSTFTPLKEPSDGNLARQQEILGPIDSPLSSISYQRNFTSVFDSKFLFHNFPYTPFTIPPPGEAKFLGSSLGYRPIGNGMGGDGKEFQVALGGNTPAEQFTIVILTYERDSILMNALRNMKGLPYLNKVLVVWNSPKPPADNILWPEIDAPIHVIKTSKNSLNNRFLPYDLIETEAILSLDDDAHLKHDEIILGFRIWREERHRLIGYPGRFHSWDQENKSWFYNSNYTCELSMVLTGAAFFHKYYAYMYTHIMPQVIRDKVDEYMNCEDIAMNFLISHITRKPPLKVTSRWSFRCVGCPESLSSDESHFQERHTCINFFTNVYGYLPLLHTQYRADSVLYRTRISHNKQKCFTYV